MKNEGILKTYVSTNMAEYINAMAEFHNMSVSRLIYTALNSPEIYQVYVTAFRKSEAYKEGKK